MGVGVKVSDPKLNPVPSELYAYPLYLPTPNHRSTPSLCGGGHLIVFDIEGCIKSFFRLIHIDFVYPLILGLYLTYCGIPTVRFNGRLLSWKSH